MGALFPYYAFSSALLSDVLSRNVCDVNALNSEGDSALDVIAKRTEITATDVLNAKVLIEQGIDAGYKAKAKQMLQAREGVHAEAIKTLMEGGDASHYFLFRKVYEEGDTGEFRDAVWALAQRAADIDAKDVFGNTLLLAVLSRLGQISAGWVRQSIEAVLAKGADKTIMDARGRTAKDIVSEWQTEHEDDATRKKEMLELLQ